MPKTVVAVAIGTTYRQANPVISSSATIPSWARKYINGFISVSPPTLGTDYVIDYRECPAADLKKNVFTNQLQADYILCFSTTVVSAAAQVYPQTSNTQIIGIVSHPEEYFFQNQGNVCGASPERSDDAQKAYENLLNTVSPALDQATVLHDQNYPPSIDSLNNIQRVHGPPVVPVTPANIQAAINNAEGSPVLFLPVDWMFGLAPTIIGWASNLNVLDFWFVTDWVVPSPNQSAFGGYGVSQQTSGVYLGQQFAALFKGQNPSPKWKHVQQNDRTWSASQTRATNAGVELNNDGPQIVP